MLKAIFFDFNGVILDDEELHFESLRKVLEEEGVSITREAYYRDCLGFNDVDCFRWGLPSEERLRGAGGIEKLVERKSVYYQELLQKEVRFFPGVCDFIRAAAGQYCLGLASMALRSEIEWTLERAGILELFAAIVSGEDVRKTKPDPEAYLEVLRRMNEALRRTGRPEASARESLVIEDSPQGVQAARSAGMKVLALAHTSRPEELKEADWVLASLEGVSPRDVEERFLGLSRC